jgi:antitoxin HigA-1
MSALNPKKTNARITTTPGEVLEEEFMKPYGLTANALAIKLQTDSNRIYEVVKGKRSITPELAIKLARLFGTNPEFWLNLQNNYNLSLLYHQNAQLKEQLESIKPLSPSSTA